MLIKETGNYIVYTNVAERGTLRSWYQANISVEKASPRDSSTFPSTEALGDNV